MTSWGIGESFWIFGLLQIRHRKWRQALDVIERYLREELSRGRNHITSVVGPTLLLGRQDLMVALKCSNLEYGVRVFYDAVDAMVSAAVPLGGFAYSISFDWTASTADIANQPIGLVLTKFKKSVDYEGEKLITAGVLDRLNDQLSQRSTSNAAEMQVFGGLSWHELVILTYADSYEVLYDISGILHADDRVATVSAIPLIPFDFATKSVFHMALSPFRAVSRIAVQGGRALDAPPHFPSALYFRALGQHCIHRVSQPSDSTQLIKDSDRLGEECGAIHYATELVRPLKTDARELNSGNTPASVAPPSGPRLRFADHRDSATSLRKLHALRTQIEMMQTTPPYDTLIPTGLVSAVNNIERVYEDGALSQTALLYFVSEIRAALLERTTGAGIDAADPLGPPIWSGGGAQRMLLACERLLSLCVQFYPETQRLLPGGRREAPPTPVILAFFDYNEGAPPRPHADSRDISAERMLPLVIRLPMMKFKPWLWPLGIATLAEFLLWKVNVSAPVARLVDLGAIDGSPDQLAIDDFVGEFVSGRSYRRAIVEHSQVVISRAAGTVTIRESALTRVMQRPLSSKAAQLLSEAAIASRRDEIRNSLLSGAFVSGFGKTRADLVAFLDAYLGLDEEHRRRPKVMSAFILSLNKCGLPARKQVTA